MIRCFASLTFSQVMRIEKMGLIKKIKETYGRGDFGKFFPAFEKPPTRKEVDELLGKENWEIRSIDGEESLVVYSAPPWRDY